MSERTLRERAVDVANRAGERFLRAIDSYFGKASLVGNHDFFDQSDFPWVRRVEAHWRGIRAE